MATRKSMWVLLGLFSIAVCLFSSQQLFAQAQQAAVPVEQEPRHRVVFQNQTVRIYDCLIPPGDITLFHTHSFDSVTVVVSGGKARNEFVGKPPLEGEPVTGASMFAKATNAPYTHRLTNIGTTPLRFVVPELLSSSSGGVPAVLKTLPGHFLLFENDRVTVYRILVDPNQSTGIRSRTLPWLRVSISQSKIAVEGPGKNPETLETRAGDFRWHDGVTNDAIKNIGSTKYHAIEIELK